MREPKNQMLGTMDPPLMQLSVKGLNLIANRPAPQVASRVLHLIGKFLD